MNTLNLKPMKFGPLLDIKSILLYVCFIIIKSTIDVKVLLEVVGAVAGGSTIFYNALKSIGEIQKFWISYRWRKKRKTDKNLPERNPDIPPHVADQDQFD